MEIKAFKLLNPSIECYVCLQTAAWVLGLADRVPVHKELAFSQIPRKQIPESVNSYKYSPTIPIRDVRGVSCLAPESIIVHIATKPDLTSKIRFGARKQSIRNDEKWKVADTSLPFSTKEMEKVK